METKYKKKSTYEYIVVLSHPKVLLDYTPMLVVHQLTYNLYYICMLLIHLPAGNQYLIQFQHWQQLPEYCMEPL